ncbi:MAG: F0F1 ATP synthase subunit delta [Candidatus Staskawiczbacteria bacterium]|jgi:F0F1-type ATP synthase delta subunit
MAKQNKTKLYAKALAEILSKKGGVSATEEKKIVNNFVKFLEKNGQIGRSKEILELAENLLLAKQGKRKITFETARAITTSQKKVLEKVINKGDIVKEKINPQLIAGIKIIINNSQQFDASMQSKLNNIL